jgi:hypothetical protein
VALLMLAQLIPPRKRFRTIIALVGLFTRVHFPVAVEPVAATKGPRTELTLVGALAGVDFPMAIELVPFGEGFGTILAVVGPLGPLRNHNVAAAGRKRGGRGGDGGGAAEIRPAVWIYRFDGDSAEHRKILLLGVGVHGLLLAGVLGSGHSFILLRND